MRQILTMTAADLLQRVRDRTVLIFGLLVPLGLITVFNLVFGGSQEVELQPATVVVSAEPGDPLATALVDVLRQVGTPEVTLERADEQTVRDRTAAGEADLGILVPPGFSEELRTGRGPTVRVVKGSDAGLEADVLVTITEGVLDRFDAGVLAGTAGALAGLDHPAVARLAADAATGGPDVELVEGEAATEQLSAAGAVVAGQAGLFLLFTVGFGVLALLAEREQGTLARLRSMPMPAGAIVTAKALSAFVLGAGATTVLLVAGGFLFDVGFGSPVAVGVLVLSAVAAATSLTFVVARVARTAEQAQATQSVLAMVLGITGGAFFPLAASGLVGTLLDLNPVSAFTRGLGITSGGGGIGDLGAPLAILLGFAAVCALASRVIPDRGGDT